MTHTPLTPRSSWKRRLDACAVWTANLSGGVALIVAIGTWIWLYFGPAPPPGEYSSLEKPIKSVAVPIISFAVLTPLGLPSTLYILVTSRSFHENLWDRAGAFAAVLIWGLILSILLIPLVPILILKLVL